MNRQIKLSDLCDKLDDTFIEELEITNMTGITPSGERVERLVLDGIKGEIGRKGEADMKEETGIKKAVRRGRRTPIRILLAAAVACLFATTVFAAGGGFTYFKSIFGDSADNVGTNITTPMIFTENENWRLTLEGMLSDGYTTELILSLETLQGRKASLPSPDEMTPLFDVSVNQTSGENPAERSLSVSYTELPEFSTAKKLFYHVEVSSLESYNGASMNIALDERVAALTLTAPVDGTAAAKEIAVNQKIDDRYTLETVQLSPLGVLLIGSEDKAQGGLPAPYVAVEFLDGTVETLMDSTSFDSGDGETVTGGGGVVIGGDPMTGPLVTQTHGQRNPDGKVVTAGEFSRFINLDQVKSIRVETTEYALP